MSKKDFLDNLRVARNLLLRDRTSSANGGLDPAASTQAHTRTALWLTPSTVKGFRSDDFQELDANQRKALADAMQEFEQAAAQAPMVAPATEPQYQSGRLALERILTVLGGYLPDQEEAAQIQAALGSVDFPPWVLSWDCEAGSDPDDAPAVWITLYVDEQLIAPDQLGRRVSEMIPRLRSALAAAGVCRWPYVRIRSAREHKAG